MKRISTIVLGLAALSGVRDTQATQFAAEVVSYKSGVGFATDWMRKDLGIAKEEASRNGVAMPLVDMVDSFYEEVQGMGGGRWDTSSLLTRYTRR